MKKQLSMGIAMLVITLSISCKKNNLLTSVSPKIPSLSNRALNGIPGNTISNGLVAYWSCANTAYDLSGNGHNGTLSSVSTATDRLGHTTGAYSFNGTSSYISVADNAALRLGSTDFTLNAWVYLNSYNSSYGSVIVGKRTSGGNNGWSWGVTGYLAPTVGVVNYNPGTTPNGQGAATVSTGNWHMVTSIYTASNQTLSNYVDNVFDNSTTSVSQPNALITALLYIGKDDPSIGGYFLDGYLSDIRIYNRAITTTEIDQLYNATTAPTSDLVAYWPLTNTANDLSGNGYNGTANAISTTTDRFGNSIGAYSFNGTSSYISVADNAALRLSGNEFTLNAWVNLNSYSTTASLIMGKRVLGVGNSGWNWGITGSASPGYINYNPGSSPNGPSISTISTGNWHMLTVTYSYANSQTLSVYIDNVLDNSTTWVSQANASTTALLYIGRDDPGGAYFFYGALNDIRIYSRAISTTEINQLYNALD